MNNLKKTTISIIMFLSIMLLTTLEVHAKQSPCCSCCAVTTCQCGCTAKKDIDTQFDNAGVNKKIPPSNITHCKCNSPGVPFKLPGQYLTGLYTTSFKKKLVPIHQHDSLAGTNYRFISPVTYLFNYKKQHPPDCLYLINSCLLI